MLLSSWRRGLFGVFVVTALCGAQSLEPIRYTVRIPRPETHYVDVTAVIPSAGQREVELKMAIWTPYVIREFAKNVEAVTAQSGGEEVPIEKYRKNRWRIHPTGAASVTVRYRVYCHEMSVQDNWVDRDFALLNGAATFMTMAESGVHRRHEVRLVLPVSWMTSITAMSTVAGGVHQYAAPDYESLVDSPIVAGNPAVHRFTVAGKEHFLSTVGESPLWDGARSARDVQKIVEEHARFWGGLPYAQYVFLNLLTNGTGGMEHSGSTAVMASRSAMTTDATYRRWLDLLSHEFFHTWNVKRLRPAEISPGEYETEPLTKSLGIAEGFTSYYGQLAVNRAGLETDDQYLGTLSGVVRKLQNAPGRSVQSLSMSSFDTWIKFYRPDENSVNTSVSYYVKGEVVAFLLDAKIRRATSGRKSLDEVMRLAVKKYGNDAGYTPEQFRSVVEDVGGPGLRPWLRDAFDSTRELDYKDALEWYGLRFAPEYEPDSSGWFGASTRADSERLTVVEVPRGTPAYNARFDAGDEIVGVGSERIRPEQWTAKLAALHPGDRLRVEVSRRGLPVQLDLVLGRSPGNPWNLEADPNAGAEQRSHRMAWLHPGYAN